MTECVYIALGSNLNVPRKQIQRAIDAIATLPETTLSQTSPLYETKPMGYACQDNFVNAVVEIETKLQPLVLLSLLQAIERAQGRIRTIKNGPRTIDCDIVLFGDHVLQHPLLTLPHPGLLSRDFVLRPLLDIAPNCRLPNGQALQLVLDSLSTHYCERPAAKL